ncbi:MAG: dihydrolipoyl dehydrogenase [Pseudomonadota bacterium]
MAETFDVIVIGGGPGGYNCAIRAAQLGLKAACIEKRANGKFGGTCLNVGCIPSKALLHASELYEAAKTEFAGLGIKTSGVALDLPQMLQQKDDAVKGLTEGVDYLFKKNKVTGVLGSARIAAPGRVEVTADDGAVRVLEAKSIVIATGSEPASIPGVTIDEARIVSSTGALSLSEVPKHMVVVGGGYIGLEMGSVWRRLGAEVTVVELLDRITPGMDGEVSKAFQRILKKQGMAFKLGYKVTGADSSETGVKLTIEPAAGGDAEVIDCDVVLVSIGRKPYADGLGLDGIGVERDGRGFIVTDHFRTSVSGVYAIGDVTHGPMLAHKAEDEAVAVAEIIAGRAGHVNYDAIPGVVYTYPEVATVGKTEEQLKEAGVEYAVGKFPFTANSRAKTNHTTDGFVKVLADKKTDRVLGVHMIGPNVGEMIAEACVAMEFGASSEDIARTSHPHPTLTEAMRQAAMGVEGWTMQM